MDEIKYISSIKMVDDSVYNIKDAEAQALLNRLFSEEIIIDCGGAPTEEAE